MSNDKPAYGPYSASQGILEFALRHPYEYVEQLRASQGLTCSCCPRGETPDTAIFPIGPSVAVQKEHTAWCEVCGAALWHES
jgi:hypothetical protein